MTPSADGALLTLALTAIAALVLLVTRWRWNPFLALTLTSLLMGGGAVLLGVVPTSNTVAWTFPGVLETFQSGLGKTLGSVAPLVILGAILGRVLAESGGATVLARRFTRFFGKANAGWCIIALAITVGLSTWFAVGLYLLLPVLFSLTRETGRPFLTLAIPMLAFLSVMHGLMPPHPGPVIAVAALQADTGKVLLWALLIGIPTAAVAGPFFARIAVQRVKTAPPERSSDESLPQVLPGFGITLLTILLPVLLMLGSTLVELLHAQASLLGRCLTGVGHPVAAMFIGVLFSLWSLGLRCGRDLAALMRSVEQSGASVGMMLLIVGAGGGFGRVLTESGVARVLGGLAAEAHLPILIYAWLAAAFIRVATGSATVAITVAAELLAPLITQGGAVNRELLVLAIGFGSLFLSNLNDGGFWIVKESLGLTVRETLQTWTITETIIGIAGLLLTLLAAALLPS
jgi:GntP family gluconate:H+ symporter